MKFTPFWAVVLLMGLALVTLRIRGDVDHVPPSTPLAALPETLGPWQGTDVPIDPDTLAVLGKGDFLNRVYQHPSPALATPAALSGFDPAEVGLFIGYFPTQRTGQSIHSPQNCLPGAGWSFLSSGVIELQDGSHDRVGDYLISDGVHQAEVLYWYQTQGRKIANDYRAKVFMLAESIRYGRTDAALVRITTMIRPGESRAQAQQRVLAFADQVTPLLPAYVPN